MKLITALSGVETNFVLFAFPLILADCTLIVGSFAESVKDSF